MTRLGLLTLAFLGVCSVASRQSELAVDTDAPLTASDLGWRKTSFKFQLRKDEVAIMQRVFEGKGPFTSAYRICRGQHLPFSVLLKPNQGGSYTDSIGSGFSVSGNETAEARWVTLRSTSETDATLEATCGDFQCVWRVRKMKLEHAIQLVPELSEQASQTTFVFSGEGVILSED